jgi:hypothetical protein
MYTSLSNISPEIKKLFEEKNIHPIHPIIDTMPG